MKPVVLVVPCMDGNKICVNNDYAFAISRCGGIPIISMYDIDLIDNYLKIVDGILLSGGGDINASNFGENNHEKVSDIDERRDYFEIQLVKKAIERNIPVFGICRGIQIINVALGGTLIQHIDDHLFLEDRSLLKHKVKFNEDGLFKEIFNEDIIDVNTIHHQVIGKIADDLIVDGISDDGYIEAVYTKNKRVFAVQWHPENLFCTQEKQRKLFQYFIKIMR